MNKDFNATALKTHLKGCGYLDNLLRTDYHFGAGESVALIGFANSPADARSACIVAVDAVSDPCSLVAQCRDLGAPIVFTCLKRELQWWKQGAQKPECIEVVSSADVPGFFQRHKEDFSPEAVYRAKTWGRFDRQYQLSFVDAGLMPIVESKIGEVLGNLILRTVSVLKSNLGWHTLTNEKSNWLVKTVFWLLAAKILRDKKVPKFLDIDLLAVNDVFERVATHYGTKTKIEIKNNRQLSALSDAAGIIKAFTDLRLTTTESLAYVYENTLVSKETRSALGTHSTPSYLVDYIIGKLAPWINEIPVDQRNVFEPACGHAAFLIAIMRLFRDLLSKDLTDIHKQRTYLRKRLHGCEKDSFALEIALLSLTLADIPNPNGWDLQCCDMFIGDILRQKANQATIFLANPPFENFTNSERSSYQGYGVDLQFINKTAEMLWRTLPYLPLDAVVGVIVPYSILHNRNSSMMRERVLKDFNILEICKFPDNIFTFSDMESAVIIARKSNTQRTSISYRTVRERDSKRFRSDYHFTLVRRVEKSKFLTKFDWDMRLPELEEVWLYLHNFNVFEKIADIGKGLQFKGRFLPPGSKTYSKHRFPYAKHGFVHFNKRLELHELPTKYWMNLDPRVLHRPGTGTTINTPQVLLNYAPVSRGPWRLKALLDREGHPVTSRFLTVRPRTSIYSLEYVWAICNSPMANAFAFTHSGKRDNLAGMIRKIPVPEASESDIKRVTEIVSDYIDSVSQTGVGSLKSPVDKLTTRDMLVQIDAEILRLYDLPPRIERQLLDYFAGWERLGVSFSFDRYFPDDFEPCFPLHEYISESFGRSTADMLLKQTEPGIPSDFLNALNEAAIAFEE